jgi:hypothetical protein
VKKLFGPAKDFEFQSPVVSFSHGRQEATVMGHHQDGKKKGLSAYP